MSFDEEIARAYDEWLQSPTGYCVDRRKKHLIADLLVPHSGETLLDVGCRTGHYLLFFRRKGCDVAGIDSSSVMLKIAEKKLGKRVEFYEGCSEDLPFSDNEFDIVTITSLGCANNPLRTLQEAIRVCRGRLFLGVFNRYSLAASKWHSFRSQIAGPSSLLSIDALFSMMRAVHTGEAVRWGGVISFPLGWYPFAAGVEEKLPVMKNPFGAFLGMTFPVIYTRITIQEPLRNKLKLTVRKERQEPVTREMEK
jgi:SAM-dependent methyltransferase